MPRRRAELETQPRGAASVPPASRAPEPVAEMPARLGRYRLLCPIGSGGMGTVFAAELSSSHGFNRVVAAKVLRAELDESSRRAFVQEAKLGAHLNHRNVVSALDFGELDGRLYIVMELVAGIAMSSLLSMLRESGDKLDPYVAAWIVAEAAEGLHAAHELESNGKPLELVHRDVSPQNVLLGFDGRVLITDFGIAKLNAQNPTTAEGVVKGKLSYMAPEQLSGDKIDRRTDVFALGIVLHEALSGKRLFVGETPGTIALAVLGKPIPPLDEDVPRPLAAVAMRCLEREPGRRFPSARAAGDALREALRARAESPSEARLAELLARRCAAEKSTFEQKIQVALEARASRVDDAEAIPRAEGATATVRMVEPRHKRGPLAIVTVAAIVALTGVAWFTRAGRNDPPPVTPPALAPTSAALAPAPEVASPSAAAASVAEAPVAEAPPAAAPVISVTPRPDRKPPRSSPRKPERASPAPPASGGVFRTLQ